MALPFSLRVSGPYTLTAGQTGPITFNWPIYNAADLTVLRLRDGIPTALVEGVDFSLSATIATEENPNPSGGSITLLAGALEDDRIVVFGERDISRAVTYATERSTTPRKLNLDLNTVYAQLQEMSRDVARAFKTSLFDPDAFDLEGRRLANIGNPSESGDAVNLAYLLANFGGGSGAGSTLFPSRTEAEAFVANDTVLFLRTEGYAAPGDGGGALYKRVVSEPAHPGKLQTDDGSWWKIAERVLSPRMLGALGTGQDAGTIDRDAFLALAQIKPAEIVVPDGTYFIDPIDIDWPCRITILPGATIAQRTTGVVGAAYSVANPVITRQALLAFVPGSEGSECTGGGWFDGRRASITGFVSEYRSKWGAVDIFAERVKVHNLNARNFHTFAFSNEASYAELYDIYVENSGQGVYCGRFDAGPSLPGLPVGGCRNQILRDIDVHNIDGAGVFQHAIDIFWAHFASVSGLRVHNQLGAAGSSSYASGITILGCYQSQFFDLSHDGFTTALGHLSMSFPGNIKCLFDGITIKGFGANAIGATGLEDVSNIDCHISNALIDGEYRHVATAINSCGVNANVGTPSRQWHRFGYGGSVLGARTKYSNITVLRAATGIDLQGASISVHDFIVKGCTLYGVIIDRWGGTANGYGTIADIFLDRASLIDGKIINCQRAGLSVSRCDTAEIKNVEVINCGQALGGADGDRSAFYLAPNAGGRNDISWEGCNAVDDQGVTLTQAVTFKPQASVGNRATITLLQPHKFDYGQHLRIPDGGGTGVNIDAWIVDYTFDEFVVEAAAPFSLASNTVALSGTWSTNGTNSRQIDGVTGAAVAEVPGPLWITDGAEWRQVLRVTNNNTLTIDQPFTTPLAGGSLTCSLLSVARGPQGGKSQKFGYRISTTSIGSMFARGNRASGNTTCDWYIVEAVAGDLAKFKAGSEYQIEAMPPTTNAANAPLTPRAPAGHSILGAAVEVLTTISGGGVTSFDLVIVSQAGTTVETIAAAQTLTAGTQLSRAIGTQSRNDTVQRQLRANFNGGTPTAGSMRGKMRCRVDAPDAYA
jgi:hypothetical protein